MPATGPNAGGEVAAVPFVPVPSAPVEGTAAGQKRQREEESGEF